MAGSHGEIFSKRRVTWNAENTRSEVVPHPLRQSESATCRTDILKSVEIRISVLASGEIRLDGVTAQLVNIEQALDKADSKQDVVLYYRENSQGEPPPQAKEILNLIVARKLRFSFSSLPDFSDYVDRFGQSHPRPVLSESPSAADPFAPRMPDVNLRPQPEEVFAHARNSASGVAVVRPDRGVLKFPSLSSIPKITKITAVPALASASPARTIAAIASTEFTMLHNTSPPNIDEAVRAIPFLHLLMAWAFIGHRVWVFEGHPSAFSAGLAESDFLILDSGMLPFLQADWMAVAQHSMKPQGKVFLYDQKKTVVLPLAPSSRPPGWRFSEPDGEASYVNCLLTALAKGGVDSVAIDSGGPVPDLRPLTTNPEESDWVAGLPFRYESLSVEKIIDILLNLAGRGKVGALDSEWVLPTKVASQNGEPWLQTFVIRRQRKWLRTIIHISKL